MRFRQVHLDFHTSPAIPEIGAKFDKKEWQETLQRAAVDSITCFSSCHHGWSYHPTQVGAQPQKAAPAPPPEPVCAPPAPPPPPPPPPCTAEHGGFLSRLLPRSIDTGDLLMLLILLLLVVDGEEEDQLSVILTAAAFLLS